MNEPWYKGSNISGLFPNEWIPTPWMDPRDVLAVVTVRSKIGGTGQKVTMVCFETLSSNSSEKAQNELHSSLT